MRTVSLLLLTLTIIMVCSSWNSSCSKYLGVWSSKKRLITIQEDGDKFLVTMENLGNATGVYSARCDLDQLLLASPMGEMPIGFVNSTNEVLMFGERYQKISQLNSDKKSEIDPEISISQAHSKTIKDIDGNIYHTVTIGTQVWLTENLKTTKYRDGSPIPNVSDSTTWVNLNTGAYCNSNNDAEIGAKYGRLYNWYAVNDNRNIAPKGWHVATDAEWKTLENYVSKNLGNSGSIAKALASKTVWAFSKSVGAVGNDLTKNNTTGLTLLPGDGCIYKSAKVGIGDWGIWWTSSKSIDREDNAIIRMLYCNCNEPMDGNATMSSDFSVRCIKD